MKRSRALASRFLPIWRLSDRLMNAEPVDFNCRADSVKPRPTGARFEEAEREADERRAKERAHSSN